jgi:hypothetical protein
MKHKRGLNEIIIKKRYLGITFCTWLYGYFLQELLTAFVLSVSVNLDLTPEGQIDAAIEKAILRNKGKLTLSKAVSCKVEGIFAINCTSYKLCVAVGGENFIGAEGTCPDEENFNPYTKQCDPDHMCPPCKREGFTCLTDTSFALCSDALELIVWNVTCPYNHCCHEAYRLPCMNKALKCLC